MYADMWSKMPWTEAMVCSACSASRLRIASSMRETSPAASVAVATLNGAEYRYAERTKTEAELAALRVPATADSPAALGSTMLEVLKG